MTKTLCIRLLNTLRNSIYPFALLCLFLLFQPAFSQTALIGGGSTFTGSGPIYISKTGNVNSDRKILYVKKANLNAAGIVNGSMITEWGYNKMSTTELVGSNQWELKIYLKNVSTSTLTGTQYSTLGNGATLVHTSIVDRDKFPVQPGFWMWQMQDYFQYTGVDILCIVEWTALQNTFNNITNLMSWQATTGGTGVFEQGSGGSTQIAMGYATRISFVNTFFAGTVTGGTITASVASANAGAPFVLLASNLSYGVDMEYQWQKSPAGLNQWANIGPESVLSSLPAVLQDAPTDYRLRSTCVTSGQSAFSNTLSIGQKANVIFTDPHLKTAFMRADPTTNNVKNLAGVAFKPDVDNDGEIQLTEALGVGAIEFITSTAGGIGGLESFLNLKKLSFYIEANFSDVAIPPLPNLEWLSFNSCSLEGITFGALPKLDVLRLSDNNLTTIDLTGMPLLRQLALNDNDLTTFAIPNINTFQSLAIQNNALTQLTAVSGPNFDSIDCSNNQLTSLHVESPNEFVFSTIKCNDNQLTSLTFNGMQSLGTVECNNNQLQSLDFSQVSLQDLDCSNNDLNTLNIRNRSTESSLNFAGNPNLAYICADYPQVPAVMALATAQGYPQMSVNDYCSFEPVGDWYILGGNSRYSATGTCDVNSIVYPYLRLKWSEAAGSNPYFLGYFFTSSLGELNEQLPYSYPSILEPELENPEYFNVSPAPFAFDFTPAPATPISQDFCVTPNGVYNDIEARIFPLTEARPGMDARYMIMLRNVGTEPSSGQITLNFEDSVMDFLSATQTPSGTGVGQLSWSYLGLQPFESKAISLSFNLNEPGDLPSLTVGDVLDFDLAATSGQPDVNPFNNNHQWHQGVINSFDPNDKTCLEGNIVGPSQIGEFVHYIIRFENTGTASAINVVVKDILDAQRFDVNSLIVLNASHPCKLRQRTNDFEFIFENINLPFTGDDAKGYVIFKVRLRDNLVLGNTFSNQAGIYFDYNLPIVTNEETTVIQVLGIGDFNANASIVIYPNPANDQVFVKSETAIRSIAIYDLQGRLVETRLVDENLVGLDLVGRAAGIYYLKITTEAGFSVQRLVKK